MSKARSFEAAEGFNEAKFGEESTVPNPVGAPTPSKRVKPQTFLSFNPNECSNTNTMRVLQFEVRRPSFHVTINRTDSVIIKIKKAWQLLQWAKCFKSY